VNEISVQECFVEEKKTPKYHCDCTKKKEAKGTIHKLNFVEKISAHQSYEPKVSSCDLKPISVEFHKSRRRHPQNPRVQKLFALNENPEYSATGICFDLGIFVYRSNCCMDLRVSRLCVHFRIFILFLQLFEIKFDDAPLCCCGKPHKLKIYE
jgi:hypothetical protein